MCGVWPGLSDTGTAQEAPDHPPGTNVIQVLYSEADLKKNIHYIRKVVRRDKNAQKEL